MEFIDKSSKGNNILYYEYCKKVKGAYQDNDLVVVSNQNILRYGIVRGEDMYVFKGSNIELEDCIKRESYGFLFTESYYKHEIFEFPISINYKDCKNNKEMGLLRDYLIKKVDYILKPTFTDYNIGDILLAKNGESYAYLGKELTLKVYEATEEGEKGEFILSFEINSKKHIYLELSIWLRQLVNFEFKNNSSHISTMLSLNSKKSFYHLFGNVKDIPDLNFIINEYNNTEFVNFLIKESSSKRKECNQLKKYKTLIMEVD